MVEKRTIFSLEKRSKGMAKVFQGRAMSIKFILTHVPQMSFFTFPGHRARKIVSSALGHCRHYFLKQTFSLDEENISILILEGKIAYSPRAFCSSY